MVRTENGPKADQPHDGEAVRYDPSFTAQGAAIKKLIKELGIGSYYNVIEALPPNLPYIGNNQTDASLRQFLAGRKGTADRKKLIDALIDLFATRSVETDADAERDGLEKTKSKIRARIYGDGSSAAEPTPTDVTPSFAKLETVSAAEYADDFLDVKAPHMGDIVAGFDIKRSIYADDDGLKQYALGLLADAKGKHLVTISGQPGAGKSVLALQLAHDCLANGYAVYNLYIDWLRPESLASQIRAAAEQEKVPCVFIFDGAANLARGETNLLDVYSSLGDVDVPVLLVGIEAWQLLKPAEVEGLRNEGSEARHFTVHRLSDRELEEFVDHVIEMEKSGKVQDVRCSLSKASRIALCSEERDRYPATALLIFRYGRSVADILIEEYDSLAGSFAQEIYTYIITFSGLGLEIPRSCISRILRRQPKRETGFWELLDRVTSLVEGRLGLRHNIFFRHIAPYAIPNVSDRANVIIDVLLSMSEENPIEDDFAQALFSKVKPIASLLGRDEQAVEHFISDGRDVSHDEVQPHWRTGWLTCLGRISSIVLLDHETAELCFAAAISAYPRNKFALRERSWNLLRAGKNDLAEQAARDAIEEFPSDVTTLVRSATVLQFTTESGFDLAGELFERALELDPEHDEARKKQESYEDAAAYKRYLSSSWEGIEDEILDRLRTPWFVWTFRKGVRSSRGNKAVRGKLSGLIQDPLGDIDQIREVTGEAQRSSDKFTKALVLANLARAEYVQWYQGGFEVDFDKIEQMFKDALSDAPREPFIRTWYGTFLKEVRKDSSAAEKNYRDAIDLASQYKRRDGKKPFENHPMLLNNLALLLMQEARLETDPTAKFMEAQTLLDAAIEKIDTDNSNFQWPKDTHADLIRLKKEAGIS